MSSEKYAAKNAYSANKTSGPLAYLKGGSAFGGSRWYVLS